MAPYPIKSVQVDGVSEFTAEFETECERLKLKLKLEVLPPSKPTYNGGVERANRTFREDFYDEPEVLADSIGALRFDHKNAVKKYNTYRPHFTLNGQTPMEYIRINQATAA